METFFTSSDYAPMLHCRHPPCSFMGRLQNNELVRMPVRMLAQVHMHIRCCVGGSQWQWASVLVGGAAAAASAAGAGSAAAAAAAAGSSVSMCTLSRSQPMQCCCLQCERMSACRQAAEASCMVHMAKYTQPGSANWQEH